MKTFLNTLLMILLLFSIGLYFMYVLSKHKLDQESESNIRPLKEMNNRVHKLPIDTFTPKPYVDPLPAHYSKEYVVPGTSRKVDTSKLRK